MSQRNGRTVSHSNSNLLLELTYLSKRWALKPRIRVRVAIFHTVAFLDGAPTGRWHKPAAARGLRSEHRSATQTITLEAATIPVRIAMPRQIIANSAAVATGHPLGASAGFEILR